MAFLGSKGYRVIAHGPPQPRPLDQTWVGNDMDQYADDLAELMKALDLRDVVLVGHSTGGGGENHTLYGAARNKRIRKAVLLGAVCHR